VKRSESCSGDGGQRASLLTVVKQGEAKLSPSLLSTTTTWKKQGAVKWVILSVSPFSLEHGMCSRS
jgi:hypothetical protein